jgi:hypothetical protein
MSFSRTGPLTLRMMEREVSSMNSTRTWVTPPREPVRPRTLVTLASLTGVFWDSCWRKVEVRITDYWYLTSWGIDMVRRSPSYYEEVSSKPSSSRGGCLGSWARLNLNKKYMSVNSNVLILVNRIYTRPIISLLNVSCVSHLLRTDGCIKLMDGSFVTYHGWMLTKKKDFCRQAWTTLSWPPPRTSGESAVTQFPFQALFWKFCSAGFRKWASALSFQMSSSHSKHILVKVSEDDIGHNYYIIICCLIKTRRVAYIAGMPEALYGMVHLQAIVCSNDIYVLNVTSILSRELHTTKGQVEFKFVQFWMIFVFGSSLAYPLLCSTVLTQSMDVWVYRISTS